MAITGIKQSIRIDLTTNTVTPGCCPDDTTVTLLGGIVNEADAMAAATGMATYCLVDNATGCPIENPCSMATPADRTICVPASEYVSGNWDDLQAAITAGATVDFCLNAV